MKVLVNQMSKKVKCYKCLKYLNDTNNTRKNFIFFLKNRIMNPLKIILLDNNKN